MSDSNMTHKWNLVRESHQNLRRLFDWQALRIKRNYEASVSVDENINKFSLEKLDKDLSETQ